MKVLFVDEHNAAASQLAQAWAEHAGLDARSAGLHPAVRLDRGVVEELDSQRLGSAEREPRILRVEEIAWADVVVAIDCDSPFPVLPPSLVCWNLPAGRSLHPSELSLHLRRLVVELVMGAAGLPILGADSTLPLSGAGRPVR